MDQKTTPKPLGRVPSASPAKFEDRLMTASDLLRICRAMPDVDVRCCAGTLTAWHMDFARIGDVELFFNEVRLHICQPRNYLNYQSGHLYQDSHTVYHTTRSLEPLLGQASPDAAVMLMYEDPNVYFHTAVRNYLCPRNMTFVTLYAPDFRTFINALSTPV